MKNTCTIQGCTADLAGRGLCKTHYARWLRDGDEMSTGPIGEPRKRRAVEERYWPKVVKGTGDECWLWIAMTDPFGYGRIGSGGIDGVPLLAHRVSWKIHNGPIPDGLHVLHHCDNPPCTNPDHLWLGTNADNQADMRAKGRGGVMPPSPTTKLTPKLVIEIRVLTAKRQAVLARELGADASTPDYATIADTYGISVSSVKQIANRKTWKHI